MQMYLITFKLARKKRKLKEKLDVKIIKTKISIFLLILCYALLFLCVLL